MCVGVGPVFAVCVYVGVCPVFAGVCRGVGTAVYARMGVEV